MRGIIRLAEQERIKKSQWKRHEKFEKVKIRGTKRIYELSETGRNWEATRKYKKKNVEKSKRTHIWLPKRMHNAIIALLNYRPIAECWFMSSAFEGVSTQSKDPHTHTFIVFSKWAIKFKFVCRHLLFSFHFVGTRTLVYYSEPTKFEHNIFFCSFVFLSFAWTNANANRYLISSLR